MTNATRPLVLGAVAYDPKVVTIWDGFRAWFRDRGLEMNYVLYAHYEHQVEDLIAGRIDVAWNSPLAWIRADRMAKARGQTVQPIVMRDSDCDLTTAIVVRAGADIRAVSDLKGRTVGSGDIDSPQATLLPLQTLRDAGLEPGRDFTVRRYDIGVGLHGDHVGGERDAAKALIAGDVDAACMLDANHLVFTREGTLPAGSTRVLVQTPAYDHCMMTAGPSSPPELTSRLTELLLSMQYSDPIARPLLDLEGLKEWRAGRVTGYGPLDKAATAQHFYDAEGNIVAGGYRP
jgi:ABC-type phosphate/phosphonate transport system substrate-binding protein